MWFTTKMSNFENEISRDSVLDESEVSFVLYVVVSCLF